MASFHETRVGQQALEALIEMGRAIAVNLPMLVVELREANRNLERIGQSLTSTQVSIDSIRRNGFPVSIIPD